MTKNRHPAQIQLTIPTAWRFIASEDVTDCQCSDDWNILWLISSCRFSTLIKIRLIVDVRTGYVVQPKFREHQMPEWTSCRQCGAEILIDSSFCQHCGSSDEDSWQDDGDGDTDDDDFDYDDFLEREFGNDPTNTDTPTLYRIVAIVLLIGFILMLLNFGAGLF